MVCRADLEYRESVLPAAVTGCARERRGLRSRSAGREIVGDRGRSVSIEHFGASADAETLFREFGVTTEAVVAAAKNSLAA